VQRPRSGNEAAMPPALVARADEVIEQATDRCDG
jgi:hypothetical protein